MNKIKNVLTKRIFQIATIILLIIATLVAVSFARTNDQQSALITELRGKLASSEKSLTDLQREKLNLETSLREMADKNTTFADQLAQAQRTADKLEWIATLDEQLLAKYSKVYFLNENYSPKLLSPIDSKHVFNKSKELEIHDWVLPFVQRMFRDAEAQGVDLKVVSAYRSFETQAALKSNYKVTYGTGANAFSADQGYSEHQLGTTLDITTAKIGGSLSGFQNTDSYKWLQGNAHKYGFTLSYPSGNKYYVFEPWHWRFVGVELATKLYNDEKFFYNLDQREINTYLANMFNSTLP